MRLGALVICLVGGLSYTACRSVRVGDGGVKTGTGPSSTPKDDSTRAFYVEKHPDRNLASYKSYTVGIGFPEAGKPFCSGLVVSYGSEKYILTAAHCLKEGGERALGVYPFFEKEETPERQTLSFPILRAAFVDRRIDLGLAVADLPPSIPALPWMIGQASPGDSIFGAGHPAGDFKMLSDQCQVLTVGSPIVFIHNCKMISGSSGSAMISKSTRQILGVMSAGAVTREIEKDGTSKMAVNLWPMAALIERFLQDQEVPLGYGLDTLIPGYHFLAFKGQVHCGRKVENVCGTHMQSVVQTLAMPKYLKILKEKFPSELLQFNGYADGDFGLLIRLRDSGEHKIEKKMIDYVYTSGDAFSELMEKWLTLN